MLIRIFLRAAARGIKKNFYFHEEFSVEIHKKMDKTVKVLSKKQKGGILESLYANSIPLFMRDKPLFYTFQLLNSEDIF